MKSSEYPYPSSDRQRKRYFSKTRITMDSEGFLQIDSCRRIMECSDIYVKVRTVDRFVEVWGSDLSLDCMSADSIIIEGKVSSLELTPAGKLRE